MRKYKKRGAKMREAKFSLLYYPKWERGGIYYFDNSNYITEEEARN